MLSGMANKLVASCVPPLAKLRTHDKEQNPLQANGRVQEWEAAQQCHQPTRVPLRSTRAADGDRYP
jgi:hypothetical protein